MPPPPAHAVTVLDVDAIEHSIWQMLGTCDGAGKNDRLIIAIEAMIEKGLNTGPRIIGMATRLGFDRRHAGAVLTKSAGADPRRHRWQREQNGFYRLHAAVPA